MRVRLYAHPVYFNVVRCEVARAVSLKIPVFSDVELCELVDNCKLF
jgi:hypothetical protein